MTRNQIPIDLTGWMELQTKIEAIEKRLEAINRAELLESLPPPYVNVKKEIRLKLVTRKCKVSPSAVAEIRAASGTFAEIGTRYGISATYAWRIKKGRRRAAA